MMKILFLITFFVLTPRTLLAGQGLFVQIQFDLVAALLVAQTFLFRDFSGLNWSQSIFFTLTAYVFALVGLNFLSFHLPYNLKVFFYDHPSYFWEGGYIVIIFVSIEYLGALGVFKTRWFAPKKQGALKNILYLLLIINTLMVSIPAKEIKYNLGKLTKETGWPFI